MHVTYTPPPPSGRAPNVGQVTPLLTKMGGTARELLEQVLSHAEAEHGAGLVRWALGAVALARSGLHELELIALLDPQGGFVPATEPGGGERVSNFSRLYASLKAFLTTGGGAWRALDSPLGLPCPSPAI